MSSFFFFNDTATTEIYPLSLHDALPISSTSLTTNVRSPKSGPPAAARTFAHRSAPLNRSCSDCRSEEHTSELQSQSNLVCRLLLEKKKKDIITPTLAAPASVTLHRLLQA